MFHRFQEAPSRNLFDKLARAYWTYDIPDFNYVGLNEINVACCCCRTLLLIHRTVNNEMITGRTVIRLYILQRICSFVCCIFSSRVRWDWIFQRIVAGRLNILMGNERRMICDIKIKIRRVLDPTVLSIQTYPVLSYQISTI